MSRFGLATSNISSVPLIAGATHEEEKACWETDDKVPEQQHCLPPEKIETTDQGLLSKLSGIEIGNACRNLTKNLGGQATTLGDQAKTFSEQAKEYTVASTATAAATVTRFKKQIVAAVDGVPPRPDEEDQLRGASGTTTAAKEKAKHLKNGEDGGGSGDDQESEWLSLEESEEICGDQGSDAKGKNEEEGHGGEKKCQPKNFIAGATGKRDQLAGGGMVDESAPMLSFGAIAAAFKKGAAGGSSTVSYAQSIMSDETTLEYSSSGTATAAAAAAMLPDAPSAAAAGGGRGGGGHQSEFGGGDEEGGGAAAMKMLPRTASLVGGKQWAVLASVYDTTAAIVDETIGEIFT